MTSSAPTDTAVSTTTETLEQCPVCAHDLKAHDATSLRFCQATSSSGLTRHCICR